MHDRSGISDSEKLVYLRSALKGGPAKQAIEGLSRSGEFYAEAVECLQTRCNRPRLIHQTHVKVILKAPPLRDGNGKELRRLHDMVQQHLRALKALNYKPSGPFVTSVLELKLDSTTNFEWRKFSHDLAEVPHYSKLLEFLNLRAQAAETSASDAGKRYKSDANPVRKSKPQNAKISGVAGLTGSAAVQSIVKRAAHAVHSTNKWLESLLSSHLASHVTSLSIQFPSTRSGAISLALSSLIRTLGLLVGLTCSLEWMSSLT